MRELTEGLSKLRNKKAAALIRVCNENLKRAVFLVLCWTALFNECLHAGTFLAQWEGEYSDPQRGKQFTHSSWQEIAKKSVYYQIAA